MRALCNRSTIDYDRDRGKLLVMADILRCKGLINLTCERSSSKRGWHFILNCKIACYECRRKYDDPRRYVADMTNRKPYQRDVLFDKKVRFYPDRRIRIVQLKDGVVDDEVEGVHKIG